MHLRHSERSEESSHFLHRILVILLPLLRHFERSEKSSYFSYHTLVTLSAAKGPVISRFAIQDFTGCFEAMPLNMKLNVSASE